MTNGRRRKGHRLSPGVPPAAARGSGARRPNERARARGRRRLGLPRRDRACGGARRASNADTDSCRARGDRKSTRLNFSHPSISYAVFCLKKKKKKKKHNLLSTNKYMLRSTNESY